MDSTKPPRLPSEAADSTPAAPAISADDDAGQDAAHRIPELPLRFTAEDVTEIARAVGIPIGDPSFVGHAGVMLKGLAEAFAEMARLQADDPMPKRPRGRPPDLARPTLFRGYAYVYRRLTGRRPNFRNKIGERDEDSDALRFVRQVLTVTAEQLERATDPENRNSARKFRRLLALKSRGLLGRAEEDLAKGTKIARMLYPRAFEGAGPIRGRPFRDRT